jgi:predicted ATPase
MTVTQNGFWAKYSFSLDSAKGLFQVTREEIDMRLRSSYSAFDEEVPKAVRYEDEHIVIGRSKDGTVTRDSQSVEGDDADVDLFDPGDLHKWFAVDPKREEYKIEQADELLVHQRRWELSQLRQRLTDFQAYSIFPNTLRTPQEPSNEIFLTPEGRNLTSVFKRMRRTKRGLEAITQIIDAMKLILPNLERISILSLGGFLVPQFHMTEASGKRHVFNVAQMSDGTLRVLGLLTALYQEPRPSVIALEEPEQTVNPGILTVLADSIKEVSRRSQVIITTHSPNLLDQFGPEDVRTVDLVGSRTHVAPVGATQLGAVRDRLFTLGELMVSEGLHD